MIELVRVTVADECAIVSGRQIALNSKALACPIERPIDLSLAFSSPSSALTRKPLREILLELQWRQPAPGVQALPR